MYYTLSCPVPKKQRPVNEYMELVQSNFFNWPIQKGSVFLKNIIKNYSLFFVLSFPISNFIFNMNQSISRLFIVNAICSTFLILLILTRLFLGWTYIKKRLYSPTIFYEESGWYDGRVWVKSKNILVQDRFIYTYQVLPALKNINKVLVLTSCLLITLILLFIFN